MAQVAQARAEDHGKDEHVYFRAMKMHERSAEIHDAIAALLPRDDELRAALVVERVRSGRRVRSAAMSGEHNGPRSSVRRRR